MQTTRGRPPDSRAALGRAVVLRGDVIYHCFHLITEEISYFRNVAFECFIIRNRGQVITSVANVRMVEPIGLLDLVSLLGRNLLLFMTIRDPPRAVGSDVKRERETCIATSPL